MHQVTWTQDGLLHLYDSISYPQTVWKKEKDDCDGFSVLAAALLVNWNSDTCPVLVTAIMHPVKSSHTVCVFVAPDGTLHYFDNANLRSNDFYSYEEIVGEICPSPNKLVCWDVRQPEDLALVEFHEV